MSEIKTSSGIEQIHGKTNGRDSGYFYMRNGKQFYRTREDFEAAKHVASNGKTYATSRAWKFNSLIHDFKQMNPFQS